MQASGIELVDRARLFADSIAIADGTHEWTYRELVDLSGRVAARLLDSVPDLSERRVCFLMPPGFDYVAVQWGIWRAGGVAVPLGTMHPPPELDYVVRDADPSLVVVHPALAERMKPIANGLEGRLLTLGGNLAKLPGSSKLPAVSVDQRAMILYTSGTTGRPKGVVTTHANLRAQITALVAAWEWSNSDRILHVLPLHHIHGIVNALCCALWAGAACEFLTPFDARSVWQRIARGQTTLLMAVPTIYVKLIEDWKASPPDMQRQFSDAAAKMRLMVSGSAALPENVLEKWHCITTHTLLERYGMTEIGMALSNPLHGQRVAGHVGKPLPTVEVRRIDEQGELAACDAPAEIEVRGPSVFREYWRRPLETMEAFHDGWFRTGDVAIVEDGQYRILGRSSTDIIKTGGYKVSALEIEEVLRTHPRISDCAVVGLDDPEWGQRVAVAAVAADKELSLNELRDWARDRLAIYKVPSRLLVIDSLPRNALGKVSKPAVAQWFDSQQSV